MKNVQINLGTPPSQQFGQCPKDLSVWKHYFVCVASTQNMSSLWFYKKMLSWNKFLLSLLCPQFRLKPNITGPHSIWLQSRLYNFDEKVLTFIIVYVTFPSHLLSSAVSCCLCTWLYMSEWELMNWLIIEVFPTYSTKNAPLV